MLSVQFPKPAFQLKKQDGKDFIFDPFRRRWLLLTPEEWVRQNFVQYLVQVMKYPTTLIAMEKLIKLGELSKRFDILVYDESHRPWMMVECKAPEVPLDESVLHQLLRYHISVPVEYLVITNGKMSYGWVRKDNRLTLLTELPAWKPTP